MLYSELEVLLLYICLRILHSPFQETCWKDLWACVSASEVLKVEVSVLLAQITTFLWSHFHLISWKEESIEFSVLAGCETGCYSSTCLGSLQMYNLLVDVHALIHMFVPPTYKFFWLSLKGVLIPLSHQSVQFYRGYSKS